MVAMMMCAVVGVFAAENHKHSASSHATCSYTRPSPRVSMKRPKPGYPGGRNFVRLLGSKPLWRSIPLSFGFRHSCFQTIAVNLQQAHSRRHALSAKIIRNFLTDSRQVIQGQRDDAGSGTAQGYADQSGLRLRRQCFSKTW